MFRNYILVALRHLIKQPVISAIKVFSLALGLTCSVLVLMHVQYIYSYDKHFSNWQNIYRIGLNMNIENLGYLENPSIPDAWIPFITRDYPQVGQVVRVRQHANGLLSRGAENFVTDLLWVSPEMPSFFSLEFLDGDATTALVEPNSIVLNETSARRYFGDGSAVGELLTFDDTRELRVTGVFRDLPPNTHLDIEIMISMETGQQLYGPEFMNNPGWMNITGNSFYLMLSSPEDAKLIADDFQNFKDRHTPEVRYQESLSSSSILLEPLEDIYLGQRGEDITNGSPGQILLGLTIFGILILAASCANFAILALSQLRQRIQEIGIRKAVGATSSHVVLQFLLESMILTLLALLIAVPFIYDAIPIYTNLTNTAFTISSTMQAGFVVWLVVLVLLVGLVVGTVPALMVSRFQTLTVIKGLIAKTRRNTRVKTLFTLIQFSLAITLIIFAIATSLQINHLANEEIGFNRSNLIVIKNMFDPRRLVDFSQYSDQALVNDLLEHPGISALGRSRVPPPFTGDMNPVRLSGPDRQSAFIRHLAVDENFISTYQINVIAGRGFSRDFPADFRPLSPSAERVYGAVITLDTVNTLGFESPEASLNQEILVSNDPYRIIGVIEPFRFMGGLEDLQQSVGILRAVDSPMTALSIRVDANSVSAALNHIDEVWERHRPNTPIDRVFFEQMFIENIANQTDGISKASQVAAATTILIAALYLFGIAFYTCQLRLKEVGIRKVLGSTSNGIVSLLTWDFVRPVLLSCVLAWPAAYLVVNRYYSNFSSQSDFPMTVYLMVSFGVVVLAALTTLTQSYRSAEQNPIKLLRYE